MESQEQSFESRIDLSGVKIAVDKVNAEIGKVLVGQQKMVRHIIAALLSNGHVLLEGVPGIAKTLAAKLTAKTIDVAFSRIQFTPDLMPSDVLGTSVFNMQDSEFVFNPGPIFSNIILIDEINRAPAKTQSALFEVMEERQVTVDGVTRKMDTPFIVLATQNPIEHEGTYRLPEAQLDRFLFKVEVDYPSYEDEAGFLTRFNSQGYDHDLSTIEPVLNPLEVLALQKTVASVMIKDELIKYIVSLVHQTRQNASIYLGASPRASLALMMGAKAFAAMSGRDFVIPEDIQEVIYPALRHRLILTPEREMEGQSPDDVIKQIMEKVEVPR